MLFREEVSEAKGKTFLLSDLTARGFGSAVGRRRKCATQSGEHDGAILRVHLRNA